MATIGVTTFGSFTGAWDVVVNSARSRNEYEFNASKFTDVQKVERGTGDGWKELLFDQFEAFAVTEGETFDSFQEWTNEVLEIRVAYIGIAVKATITALERISTKAAQNMGDQVGNAMARKRNADVITLWASATLTLGTDGVPLTYGVVSAAVAQVRTGRKSATSTTHEPWAGPVTFVTNSYGVKQLKDELLAGLGTYFLPAGTSAEAYEKGMLPNRNIDGAFIAVDDNIPIDATDDAISVVFASGPMGGIVTVEEKAMIEYKRFDPATVPGAEEQFMYAGYQHGERGGGNRVIAITHDSTPPTS